MKTVLQIEFTPELLEDREFILRRSGCRVISAVGREQAKAIDLLSHKVGVVVIGHRAERRDRAELVRFFKEKSPDVAIVCLIRRTDAAIQKADYNLPADNPTLWEQTALKACGCYH